MLSTIDRLAMARIVRKSMDWNYDPESNEYWSYPSKLFWACHNTCPEFAFMPGVQPMRVDKIQGIGWIVTCENATARVINAEIKKKKQALIYLMFSTSGDSYKIGISHNPEKRLSQIKTARPDCILCASWKANKMPAKAVEYFTHDAFAIYNDGGEWFRLPVDCVTLSIDFVNNVLVGICDGVKIERRYL